MKPSPFANPRFWIVGATGALVALVVVLNFNKSPSTLSSSTSSSSNLSSSTSSLSTGTTGGTVLIAGVQTVSPLARDHKSGSIAYPDAPPAGGDHAATWQNCGIYSTQVKLEKAVHSLEHGAVWITYKPDLDPAQVSRLRDLGRGNPFVLVAPYTFGALDQPVAILAWGYRLIPNGVDDPRIAAFIKAYANNPRGPEPGAPCTGGDGTPNA